MPPEAEEPVDPLVPELLLVPADPPPEGVVAVELPDAPMPELVPEDEVPLGLVAALPRGLDVEAEPDGVDNEPVAEPPVEPMPEAVPEALPEAVVPQAVSAAAQNRDRRSLVIYLLLCGYERSREPMIAVCHMGVFPSGRALA